MDLLPTPKELLQKLPTTGHHQLFISKSRKTIRNILNSQDPRLLLIVGPCSIHNITSAQEYATNLKQLSQLVSSTLYLIMRVYFEKPRTTIGWKGLLYDPFLDGTCDIRTGLFSARQLLLTLAELGVPTATEFLDPLTPQYYSDLISWGSIGARTCSSQIHRQMASSLPMPVGFKNTTEGNVDPAINGMISASHPHTYIGSNEMGQLSTIRTQGNPDTHLVLRGGEKKTNYDPESLEAAAKKLDLARLSKRFLVDCSHDNSEKKHDKQPMVFQSLIHQSVEGNENIRGMLLESNLHAGTQPHDLPLDKLKYGISITDPCLDWHSTERLIAWAHDRLKPIKTAKETMVHFSHGS